MDIHGSLGLQGLAQGFFCITKSLGSFHWVWLGSRLGLRSFLKVCSIAACCLRNKEKHGKGETSPSKKEGKEKKVKNDKEKDDWRVHANPSRQIFVFVLRFTAVGDFSPYTESKLKAWI